MLQSRRPRLLASIAVLGIALSASADHPEDGPLYDEADDPPAGTLTLAPFDPPVTDADFCTDDDEGSHDFVTGPAGEKPAYGMFTAPATAPKVLVVIGHGSTHTVESWRPHAELLTEQYGAFTVAMEYRGMQRVPGKHHDDHDGNPQTHLPEAQNWPQKAGGEDLIAAAKLFQSACGFDTTILVGISMGVAMSGYAVSHIPAGDEGLFDYWVAVEGVHDMLETYHEAVAVGHPAAGWIETETGGTPAEQPQEYQERTNVAQTAAIEAAGLSRVVYLHAVYDGLVAYHQTRQMATELQVPYEFYTVTTRGHGSDGSTVTDLFIDAGDGILAGHAGEWDAGALLMRASFERIGAIATGDLADCGEYLVEEGEAYPDVVFPALLTRPCDGPGGPGGGSPSTPGKVTGGGKIAPDSQGELAVLELATLFKSDGGKANFGFVVEFQEGDAAPTGNLTYRDHEADVKIKGRSSYHALQIEDGTLCGPDSHAVFIGTADVNGQQETVQVEVDDCGEPGTADSLQITTDSYSASGVLTGGNIRIHRP